MKKIAIVLYYYFPYKSGLSEYAKDIAENLQKTGNFDVTVFATKHDKNLATDEIVNNIKIKRHNVLFSISKGVLAPSLSFDIIKNQKQFDKILIFLPLTEAGFMTFFLKKEKIIPFYVCDIRIGDSKIAKGIEYFLYKSMHYTLKKAKKIVPLSKDFFENSRINRNYFEKKVLPLRPFVPLKNDISKNVDYREKYNIDKDTFVIGFLGRIVFEKGIDYLINSIKYLKEKGIKDFKILIGGDYKQVRGGSVFDQLKSLIDENKENIVITGFIPEEEKANFFKAVDVLVLPSIDRLEAFGIVQIEAMKYGIPVIASSLPGVREIVQKTKFGLLVEPKNSKDIAEKIYTLYSHKIDFDKYKDMYKKVYDEKMWKKELIAIMNN